MTRSTQFVPFEIIEGSRKRGLILIGDHARRELPDEYGRLGLPPIEFERHIAYDIGVEQVIRQLAARLDAPAIIANFSRLLIDPNRGEEDPTLIRQLYDGTVVPGNYPMSKEEHQKRLNHFYQPYHDAVSALIASVAQASNVAPFILSIHSFTPVMGQFVRPWEVGILWDLDPRAAQRLIMALSQDCSLTVGDNEPYDGALRGDTMFRHATTKGYAHALIEIRQDLIDNENSAERWAAYLAPIIDTINQHPEMHEIHHYGSRTGPL